MTDIYTPSLMLGSLFGLFILLLISINPKPYDSFCDWVIYQWARVVARYYDWRARP